MGGLIVEVVDEGFAVGKITVTELRVKVVDCRSNENITKARTSRVKIICGGLTIDKKFDLEEDKEAINVGSVDSVGNLEGSMIALQRLGYETAATATKKDKLPKAYDATWRGYYNNYWKARVPDFQDLETGNPTPDMMNHIINEYNSHRATDDDGFLRVKVPVPMLAANMLSVEIGFFNFPVVQEATLPKLTLPLRRSDDVNVETQFDIKWNGTQNITWNNDTHWGKAMGWEVRQSRTLGGELKVSETLDVGVFSALKVFNIISFSRFYIHDNNTTPHFVLIGMQWCQPVWDGIDDPTDSELHQNRYKVSSDGAFVNKKDANANWIKDLNMHMVTAHKGGDVNPFGHYYGFYETKLSQHRAGRSSKHHGVDFYGGKKDGTTPVFAISGGYIVKHTSSGLAHYMATLYIHQNSVLTSKPHVVFMHMHESAKHTNKYIMSGTMIGYCGRSGFSTTSDPSHLHFEFRPKLNDRTGISDLSKYFNGMGSNINLFRENKYPLILPCKCVMYSGLSKGDDPSGCQFSEDEIITACWAIQEYPYTNTLLNKSSNNSPHRPDDMDMASATLTKRYICPHVFTSSNAVSHAQLLAKLRFIFENSGVHRTRIPKLQTLLNMKVNSTIRSNGISNRKLTSGGNWSISEKGWHIPIKWINTTTQGWIKIFIEAYQETLSTNNSDKTKTVTIDDTTTKASKIEKAKIIKSHVNLFVEKYESGGRTSSGCSLVDGAFNWLNSFNFS